VYRKGEPESEYGRPLETVPLQTPSYLDTTVAVGTGVCYVVTTVAATDAPVESAFSNEVCTTMKDVAAPAAPLGLAVLVQEKVAEVSWSPSPEPDLAEYRVYRAPKGGSATLLTTSPPGTTAFVDSTLESGTAYTYTVTAVDKAGNESAASIPAQARRP